MRDFQFLIESNVGITEYINPELPGFKGIIKQRFSDFIVNEIDDNGNVVILTDLKAPEQPKPDSASPETSTIDPLSALQDIFKGVENLDCEEISSQMDLVSQGKQPEAKVSVDGWSKENRKSFHKLVGSCWPGLSSETNDTFIRVFPASKATRGNWRRKINSKDERYTHFTLYKENRDTMDCITAISKLLYISTKSFAFAGTKDRRGITTQRVSVERVSPKRLSELNAACRNMALGNFTFSSEAIWLGQLQGNCFTILLRAADCSQNDIKVAVDSMKANGFINYFGMQRFGTGETPTHHVGIAILKKDWRLAVELILTSVKPLNITNNVKNTNGDSDGEERAAKRARSVEDFEQVLDNAGDISNALSRRFVAERCVLNYIHKDPGNFANAVSSIPRNLRTMYVHAYQSYTWNHAASERLRIYGQKVAVGDLVLVKATKFASFADKSRAVKVVSEHDVANGTYEITDIVLPLPGSQVQYPANAVQKVYSDAVSVIGVDMKSSAKEYAVTGDYRFIVAKPVDIEAYNVEYNSDDDDVLENPSKLVLGDHQSSSPNTDPSIDANETTSKGDKEKGVVLKFKLGVSSYATMCLRELMKIETSKEYQKGLN